MDGLLIVDKPVGPTSHDVVARMRRVLRERRIGHTGTLDPLASGVLPLVVGRATRLARFLSASDKAYEVVIRLGVATDSGDAEGAPIGDAYTGPMPDRDTIERALEAFRGTFLQQPPVLSAKKIGGQRSYALARAKAGLKACATSQGESDESACGHASARPGNAEREHQRQFAAGVGPRRHKTIVSSCPEPVAGQPQPVTVTVSALEIVAVAGELLTLRVDCSAGFYVRSLAHDLGTALGTGAHVVALRRTRSGDLTLAEAIPLADAEQAPARAVEALIPLSRMLRGFGEVVLTPDGVRRATHGQDLGPSDWLSHVQSPIPNPHSPIANPRSPLHVRLLSSSGDLVGIAEASASPGLLHPSVVLM